MMQLQYNAANQRTRRTDADGTYWVYGCNALGQIISGRRYWADATAVAGQQFEYGFDDIGNRKSSGGRASAVGSYTNNLLSQFTERGVAPTVDVLGLANPTTDVTVGIQGGTTYNASRKGEYFHSPLSVAHTWDGENRLAQMLRDTATPSGARQKLVFEFTPQNPFSEVFLGETLGGEHVGPGSRLLAAGALLPGGFAVKKVVGKTVTACCGKVTICLFIQRHHLIPQGKRYANNPLIKAARADLENDVVNHIDLINHSGCLA